MRAPVGALAMYLMATELQQVGVVFVSLMVENVNAVPWCMQSDLHGDHHVHIPCVPLRPPLLSVLLWDALQAPGTEGQPHHHMPLSLPADSDGQPGGNHRMESWSGAKGLERSDALFRLQRSTASGTGRFLLPHQEP
jgi:hypothetical protein